MYIFLYFFVAHIVWEEGGGCLMGGFISILNYNVRFAWINGVIKLCISNNLANFAANCMLAVDVLRECVPIYNKV